MKVKIKFSFNSTHFLASLALTTQSIIEIVTVYYFRCLGHRRYFGCWTASFLLQKISLSKDFVWSTEITSIRIEK